MNRNDLSMLELLRWYRERCNWENHIKELKRGFGIASLPCGDFFVNPVYLRIMTLAFNLIGSFKSCVSDIPGAVHT